MLIEFMGLPGSGKSTLIFHTEKRLRKAGCPVQSIGKLSRKTAEAQAENIQYLKRYSGRNWLYGCFSFAQKYPDVFDVLFQNTRDDFHKTIWSMDFLAQLFFLEEANTGDDLVFLDEGFMQRGAAAFLGKEPDAELDNYLNTVPAADVVVYIGVGPRLSYSRSKARKSNLPKLFIGATKLETLHNLTAHSKLLDYIKRYQSDCGVDIIELDGANDLADNVKKLVAAIEIRRIETFPDN